MKDEAPLEGALVASGIALWSYDIARDIVTWDAALQAIAGTNAHNGAELVAAVEPDDRDRVWGNIQRAMVTGKLEDIEFRWRRPSGEVRWFLGKGQAELDASGRVVRLVGGGFDITERQAKNERALLASRLDSIARLASGIAHDFNNMLTVMLGSANHAAARLAESGDQPELKGDLDALKQAAERSAMLTSRLLAFARKQAHSPKRFSLEQVVRGHEPTLRELLGRGVALQLELAASTRAHGDPSQIEQVLTNLAVNAREALPRGGMVRIATRDAGLGVQLAFSDNGPGIAAEHLPRLFEPFFTTKPTGVGLGLGLATSYGIIVQNQGRIWIESEPGRGTTVFFELPPSSRAATEPRLPTLQPRPESQQSVTVLVVEDEELVRRTAVRGLERHGYRVIAAESGPAALQILRTTAIDIVVSDLIMPEMTGQELAVIIREAWPSMRILFVSGYSDAEVGDIELLPKPFTPASLAARVQKVLARP